MDVNLQRFYSFYTNKKLHDLITSGTNWEVGSPFRKENHFSLSVSVMSGCTLAGLGEGSNLSRQSPKSSKLAWEILAFQKWCWLCHISGISHRFVSNLFDIYVFCYVLLFNVYAFVFLYFISDVMPLASPFLFQIMFFVWSVLDLASQMIR